MREDAGTGVSAGSSAGGSAVIFPEMLPWYASSSSTASRSTSDRAHDAGLARAVDLDLGAVGGYAVTELGRHDARHLVLAADDADVARRGPGEADDGGEL